MSLYARIGGPGAVTAAVDAFYRLVWADPALSQYFKGVDRRRLKAHQRSFLEALLDGSSRYGGRALDEAHAGLGVTDAAFDRMLSHLGAALEGVGVASADVERVVAEVEPLRSSIVRDPGTIRESPR